MMPASRGTIPYADYVAAEERSAEKHWFLDGHVFAMAGGTPEHAALAAAVVTQLAAAVRDRPCRVFTSDARVRVQATGLATYPDVTVVCGRLETDAQDPHAIVNPLVLVEVLSDSTEAHDRGEKAAHYRHIPSLREYVVVSHRERRIEAYRRNEAGRWELFEAGPGETARVECIGCAMAVDDVYRDPLAR